MAHNRRINTVYDFSSLRLHPDGTRVQQSDENFQVPKKRQLALRNARSNWIAKDAGGLGLVKRRYTKFCPDEGGEEIDLGDSEVQASRTYHWLPKKYRFKENLDFLDSLSAKNTAPVSTGEEPCLPVPSSDLLKCIHHYAASFYTERGELWDLAKIHRKERKQKQNEKVEKYTKRKRKKRRLLEDSAASAIQSDDDGTPSSSSAAAGSSPSGGESEGENEPSLTKRPLFLQDMCRVMDGSALMVLSMLVQEHVTRLVRGNVREGWEQGPGQEADGSEEESGEEEDSEGEDLDDDSRMDVDEVQDGSRDEDHNKWSDEENKGPSDAPMETQQEMDSANSQEAGREEAEDDNDYESDGSGEEKEVETRHETDSISSQESGHSEEAEDSNDYETDGSAEENQGPGHASGMERRQEMDAESGSDYNGEAEDRNDYETESEDNG